MRHLVLSFRSILYRGKAASLKRCLEQAEAAGIEAISRFVQRAALEAARERFSRYRALRDEHLNRKIERTREYSRLNIEQARALRNSYDRQEQR